MSGREGSRFQARLRAGERDYRLFDLRALAGAAEVELEALPFAGRVLVEMALRDQGPEAAISLARQLSSGEVTGTISFRPARLLLQDYTGVPLLVDLAAMRDQAVASGLDPATINPRIPTDLVIDHSVQAGVAGVPNALEENEREERRKNGERLGFLRWAAGAFSNLKVVPPGNGIVHQINLERLTTVVATAGDALVPDTVIGTDSHTTMVNGLGVLGWGVGGLEAEAIMLGAPIAVRAPPIVGVHLRGRLRGGVTATDLVLSLTELFRAQGVVGALLEFTGEGVATLSAPVRCTVANMAPEYGATAAFFPVDDATLEFLAQTGRSPELIDRASRYLRRQGLFREREAPAPRFRRVLEVDLGAVETCLAGPTHPHQRVPLSGVRPSFEKLHGLEPSAREPGLTNGAIAIAAITSCTNTSNPAAMIAAGLLARRAVERGLKVPPHVKTSFTPGSRAVPHYLRAAGLLSPLEALGFHVAAYGCATCNGGSGALAPAVSERLRAGEIALASVLSGNRNFERRVHADIRANYLASPPLVVAFALAGNIRVDLDREPLAADPDGKPVHLGELWPKDEEIAEVLKRFAWPEEGLLEAGFGPGASSPGQAGGGSCFQWDPGSTYIRRPPYFDATPGAPAPIAGARALLVLGDDVTTDHISPVGEISPGSPAGQFLLDRGVQPSDFNSYGSRRGNHEVMVRGAFSSRAVRNALAPELPGGTTVHLDSGERMSVFHAAEAYRASGTPLVILAGRNYGSGSSRDWAAKGPWLLGVRAILAESFERIHRTNLIATGILPLELPQGGRAALGLTGRERFSFSQVERSRDRIQVRAEGERGELCFEATARLDSEAELEVYRSGGMLWHLMRTLAPLEVT